jgi:hypothetical protein
VSTKSGYYDLLVHQHVQSLSLHNLSFAHDLSPNLRPLIAAIKSLLNNLTRQR